MAGARNPVPKESRYARPRPNLPVQRTAAFDGASRAAKRQACRRDGAPSCAPGRRPESSATHDHNLVGLLPPDLGNQVERLRREAFASMESSTSPRPTISLILRVPTIRRRGMRAESSGRDRCEACRTRPGRADEAATRRDPRHARRHSRGTHHLPMPHPGTATHDLPVRLRERRQP
jgi:hypothetical protein